MKRAGFTLFCALLLATPAHASGGPRDFEMRGPAAGAVLAGVGAYRSPVLRARRRFDLVGMRWSGRGTPTIALRARRAGGHWTKWTRVPADPDDAPDSGSRERSPRGFSAPVWTGDADFVQYHLSRRVARLALHFVSVAPPKRRALAARRSDVQTGQPPIHPRADWGAADCPPRADPSYGEV